MVAFLFSSNALRVTPVRLRMPQGRADKLGLVRADRIGLAQGRIAADGMAGVNPELDRACDAPDLLARFGEAGHQLRAILGRVPGDRVILVGDMELERDWCAAGRLAGYLPAARYFGTAVP